jgi:hypothetical protein
MIISRIWEPAMSRKWPSTHQAEEDRDRLEDLACTRLCITLSERIAKLEESGTHALYTVVSGRHVNV